ncbi:MULTISPECIES: lysozyme [Acidiphilium]|uniref:lysozyme n=1 Tax=Acidiphilium TaxID=522 RepID=UPI00257E567C|nr:MULTISPECIES: lysozyme [Acidiphilium]HQT84044.1 lysozyme [Acidiphilium rubrum]
MDAAVTPDPLQIAATQLVEPFEGFSAEPYRDPGGVWSIGYGSTIDAWGNPVTADTPAISQADALALVERDLAAAQNVVSAAVFVPLDANQQAALIDFIYNVGAGNFYRSTLLALLNQGDYQGAAAQFVRWDYAAGVVLPGLLRRREAEAALFNQDQASLMQQDT